MFPTIHVHVRLHRLDNRRVFVHNRFRLCASLSSLFGLFSWRVNVHLVFARGFGRRSAPFLLSGIRLVAWRHRFLLLDRFARRRPFLRSPVFVDQFLRVSVDSSSRHARYERGYSRRVLLVYPAVFFIWIAFPFDQVSHTALESALVSRKDMSE